MMLRRTPVAAALGAVAVLAAACGGSSGSTSSGPSASTGSQSSSSAASSSSTSGAGGSPAAGGKITVGAANFAENEIIANMYALVLKKAGYDPTVKTLASREVIIPAMKSGDLDVEPDYAATLLEFVDGGKGLASPNVQNTVSKLRSQLSGTGLTALNAASAIDTNGFAVTTATAQKDHLKNLSDLKGHASSMVLGGAPECPQRPYCLPGLKKVYGLNFKSFLPLDVGGPITHQALRQGRIQVGEIFTTDSNLDGLVLLNDDKHLQNADNVIPIVTKKLANPTAEKAINAVQADLTTKDLQQLNAQVINDHKQPQDVAKAWLTSKGLL